MSNKFIQFPKTRNPLPKEYEVIYVKEYEINRKGESFITRLSMGLEKWLHKVILKRAIPAENILEIGAGTFNHLDYERNFKRYDVVEPFEQLYANSKDLHKVNKIHSSIYEIDQKSVSYDRIISIAVLEHVLDLPKLIAYSGLLLSPQGQFQNSIPSQGGLLWYMAYNLTTGIAFYLRNKLNYNTIMNFEHVNTCSEVEEVIRYFYDDVKISRFPLPLLNLSFYTYIEAKKPNIERCKQYIEEAKNNLE